MKRSNVPWSASGKKEKEKGRPGEEEYRGLVDSFVEWCEQNHLLLNTSKTKEMVVDFRTTEVPLSPGRGCGGGLEL